MGAGYVIGDNTQMTAGGGQILIAPWTGTTPPVGGGYDVGYAKGKIGMAREVENLVVKSGIPKSIILQLLLGEDYKLDLPQIQVGNINNLGVAMGIEPNSEAGTPVVVAFGLTPGVSVGVFTFAPANGSDVEYIQFGPNLDDLVVKNVAEDATFVLNDDYIIVNAATGLVMATPGGALDGGGEIVHCSYQITPVAYEELLLGKVSPLKFYQIEYLHISPAGSWLLHYKFWKCQGDGSVDLSLDTEGSDVMVALAKMVALNDQAHHPSSSTVGPTGFIRLVPAALVSAYLATVTVAV